MLGHQINLNEKQAPRKVANGMSVYTYPFKWRSWRGFWGNIRVWFENRAAVKQRAKQGYCIGDVWSAGDTIVDYIINVLCEYRNRTNGWPDRYFTTFEEWIAYIDEIIDLLDYSRQDTDEFNELTPQYYEISKIDRCDRTEEQNKLVEDFFRRGAEIYEDQCAKCKVAFAKLAAYINEIWY
jgi:hypothetical protein